MKFIQALFAVRSNKTDTDAFSKLREAMAENDEDKLYIHSFRNRTVSEEVANADRLAEFSKHPDLDLAEKIVDAHVMIENNREILSQLSELASKPVKARMLKRTVDALRPALEAINTRLLDELEKSRAHDAMFARDSAHRVIGGAVNAGHKNETELAEMVVSPASAAIAAGLDRCQGYLSRLDSLNFDQLRGPIEFVLGQEQ